MFTPIHSVYFAPRSGYSEENQESNQSQTSILGISQPSGSTPPPPQLLPCLLWDL